MSPNLGARRRGAVFIDGAAAVAGDFETGKDGPGANAAPTLQARRDSCMPNADVCL